MLAFWQCI